MTLGSGYFSVYVQSILIVSMWYSSCARYNVHVCLTTPTEFTDSHKYAGTSRPWPFNFLLLKHSIVQLSLPLRYGSHSAHPMPAVSVCETDREHPPEHVGRDKLIT